eukprot:CAMPEP_0204823492 /NCGR_PEP_ID=MMETSP1346-20131115/1564_1 /ASSEMBLY_ACC=CAM_ASM_000771 /TAXON_ID=215587 /ORGANISM="Aplanochytrium stocchinoi, Strain GSBS06" /LENGTH=54 /DNA_ID=CAMNT_0051950151 /DNA_START=161 /DNA_END=325 /DNA_ORIENTATION=+
MKVKSQPPLPPEDESENVLKHVNDSLEISDIDERLNALQSFLKAAKSNKLKTTS